MPLQQLPGWIQFGALMLAFNAGMINALSLVTVLHQSISHMTGNVSMFAVAWADQNYHMMFYLILVVLFFVLGAFYSGYILGDGNLQLGRRYGIPLTLVSIFTVLCWCFIPFFPRYALLWAAAAMGMQNAMVSHYRGTIIRTTHLSGVLTDIGLALGYLMRGLYVDPRRLLLHFSILFGFFSGGLIATFCYKFWGMHAFLIPAGVSALLSLTYWALYLRRQTD